MSFTWIPFYEQMATRLLDYRERQNELIEVLRGLKAKGLPMVPLNDSSTGAATAPLTTIDPFTVFATFNRGTLDQKRLQIMEAFRTALKIDAALPVDFDGIPVVDNQQSRFFSHGEKRKPGDIPALWNLFSQAVVGGRSSVVAQTFDQCLLIHSIGVAKLTMGLFWVRPRDFLPLDQKSTSLLSGNSLLVPKKLSWGSYSTLLAAVQQRFLADFPAISLAAFTGKPPALRTTRYWAGGHYGDDGSKLEQFKATRSWSFEWPKGSPAKGATGAWKRIQSIQPGDLFAIKGYGGKNDLVIHLIGRVETVDATDGRLTFEPLDRRLFHGKAPGGPGDGTWFETLVEVSNEAARASIFGTPVTDSKPDLVPPLHLRPNVPKNLILYGPPGTGKTWEIINRIRPQFRTPSVVSPVPLPDAATLSWFEVIALALDDLGPSDVPDITMHPLVQAKYAERAVATPLSNIVWAQLQGHSLKDSPRVRYGRRYGVLAFDRADDGKWILPNGLPEELTSLAATQSDAKPADEDDNNLFVTFHPSFSYEDFVEGLRPETDEGDETVVRYPVVSGVFRKACERAVSLSGHVGGLDAFCRLPKLARKEFMSQAPPLAVLIDEINRGNVARILGELITLLEEDKRLGEDNEIIVTLPSSKSRFGVPSNLWVIGTMNTADRSVVALDTALRRRFAFRALQPRPELLADLVIDGVDMQRLLATLNRRLERLRDRDHLIGHAFFMSLHSTPEGMRFETLKLIFASAVIPLLSEFFYEDYGRIGLVLGPAFVQVASSDDGKDLFAKGFVHEQMTDFLERPLYRLTPVQELTSADFRAIYE